MYPCIILHLVPRACCAWRLLALYKWASSTWCWWSSSSCVFTLSWFCCFLCWNCLDTWPWGSPCNSVCRGRFVCLAPMYLGLMKAYLAVLCHFFAHRVCGQERWGIFILSMHWYTTPRANPCSGSGNLTGIVQWAGASVVYSASFCVWLIWSPWCVAWSLVLEVIDIRLMLMGVVHCRFSSLQTGKVRKIFMNRCLFRGGCF